jgi:hypothetical protein
MWHAGYRVLGKSLYVMDLRFEGIYRMILIGEFELPRGSTSWGTALQCYQVLNIIRVIVNNGATSYQTAIRMNKQSKSRLMIRDYGMKGGPAVKLVEFATKFKSPTSTSSIA